MQLATSTKLPLDCREMSRTLEVEFDALKNTLINGNLNADEHIDLSK